MIRRARLRPMSLKRRQEGQKWTRVKCLVRVRARGLCEAPLCRRRLKDFHHIQKRSQGGPDSTENVVALCRWHHDRTDAPYAKGRLVIEPKGGGRFAFTVVVKADKWTSTRQRDASDLVDSVGSP